METTARRLVQVPRPQPDCGEVYPKLRPEAAPMLYRRAGGLRGGELHIQDEKHRSTCSAHFPPHLSPAASVQMFDAEDQGAGPLKRTCERGVTDL